MQMDKRHTLYKSIESRKGRKKTHIRITEIYNDKYRTGNNSHSIATDGY